MYSVYTFKVRSSFNSYIYESGCRPWRPRGLLSARRAVRCTRGAAGGSCGCGGAPLIDSSWRQSTCSPRATARRPVLFRKSAGRFSRRISQARRAVVYLSRWTGPRHVTRASICICEINSSGVIRLVTLRPSSRTLRACTLLTSTSRQPPRMKEE